MTTVQVDYCGEWYTVEAGAPPFTIGRSGDLDVDDNPYLHRSFLELHHVNGVWLLVNVGTQLQASVADVGGNFTAHLSPGATLPLVFDQTLVRFSAGPTTYELRVVLLDPPFDPTPHRDPSGSEGETTRSPVELTPDQRRVVLALAEPALSRIGTGPSVLPTNAQAAARLGWTEKRFHKKLDALCQTLSALGVRGLHGGPGDLASNRRARLVEYCVSTGLVTADDLTEQGIVP